MSAEQDPRSRSDIIAERALLESSDTEDSQDGNQDNYPYTRKVIIQEGDELGRKISSASTSKPSHNPQRNKSKISNSEIMFAIRSLDGRIRRLEEGMGECIRLLNLVLQNNPTFVSAGRSGPLMKSTPGSRSTSIAGII